MTQPQIGPQYYLPYQDTPYPQDYPPVLSYVYSSGSYPVASEYPPSYLIEQISKQPFPQSLYPIIDSNPSPQYEKRSVSDSFKTQQPSTESPNGKRFGSDFSKNQQPSTESLKGIQKTANENKKNRSKCCCCDVCKWCECSSCDVYKWCECSRCDVYKWCECFIDCSAQFADCTECC